MRASPPYRLLVILLIGLPLSCSTPRIKSPAIRDFSPALQPALTTAVATSVAGYDSGAKYIREHATDAELVLLGHSEHPILRAIALGEMTRRRSFDHQKIILQNLDDTAIVFVDQGEWGDLPTTVSDQMIEKASWKTSGDRQVVVNEILLHHNYLKSAYTGLRHVDSPGKYYDQLKTMVNRDRPYPDEREYALYALAKCRRKEDIPLIKETLLGYTPWLNSGSFRLMEEFPDTSYMEVLRSFLKRRFYRSICLDHSTTQSILYLGTLGSYKNDSSAAILQSILARKPFMPCTTDTFSLRTALMNAIWLNPCPAYSHLRSQIKWYFDKQARLSDNTLTIQPIDSPIIFKDTSSDPFTWYTDY